MPISSVSLQRQLSIVMLLLLVVIMVVLVVTTYFDYTNIMGKFTSSRLAAVLDVTRSTNVNSSETINGFRDVSALGFAFEAVRGNVTVDSFTLTGYLDQNGDGQYNESGNIDDIVSLVMLTDENGYLIDSKEFDSQGKVEFDNLNALYGRGKKGTFFVKCDISPNAGLDGRTNRFAVAIESENDIQAHNALGIGRVIINDGDGRYKDVFDGPNTDKVVLVTVNPLEEIPEMDDIIIAEMEEGTIESTYSCGICDRGEHCVNGQCVEVPLENENFSGNEVCEAGESFDGRATLPGEFTDCIDCNPPCMNQACNQYVTFQCACDEYDVLTERHGCVGGDSCIYETLCSDCGGQEELFSEAVRIQSEVIQCLSNYFEFRPHRVIYKVYHHPDADPCNNGDGCSGREGGIANPDYILLNELNGEQDYGEIAPTRPEQLYADVHELTHYFIYQMLHGVPSWFQETMAMQTYERLDCSDRYPSRNAESYLHERPGDTGGIMMDDGTYFNADFYRRLRDGETSLSEDEAGRRHYVGALFAMGLKEDYRCGARCLKDVIIKLRELEQEFCRGENVERCSVNDNDDTLALTWLGHQGELETTRIIKEAIDEVVGEDTEPLFDLLEIEI